MFGQSSTFGTGGFGQAPAPAPTNNPFGSPPPSAFGSSPPAATPFGSFGGGTTTTATGGGGLFGSSMAAPPPPALGGGGGLFGAPAPAAPSLFGSGGLGGGAPAPSSSLFGAAPASSTPFGGLAPAPSTLGGGGGLFGSPPASAPGGGGLFGGGGGLGTGSSLFGAPSAAPTSTFGLPSTTPGMMGGGAPGGGGTRHTAFAPTARPDGANQIYLHSITAMPAYEDSSFEELRFQDYASGNRGSAASTPTASNTSGGFSFGGTGGGAGGGLFGAAPAPATTGLFSSTGTTTGGGLFGAPAPAAPTGGGLFGGSFGTAPASTPGAFGAPAAAAGGGFFGAPAPAPATTGFFGAAPSAAAPTPGAFGGFGAAPAPGGGGGLFGSAPAPASFGGGFGTSTPPAPTPGGFGTTTTPPGGGLFGSAPAPSTSFGGFGAAPAPAPTGAFGTFGSPAPLGGAPAPSAFGGFGAPAPAPFGSAPAPGGGLFGSAPAPAAPGFGGAFGGAAPAPPSLFGSAPAPSSLFGSASAPSTPSFFGSSAPAPSSLFGGGIGAPAPSLFGTPSAAPAPPSAFGFGSPTAPSLFGAAPAPSPWGMPAPAAGGPPVVGLAPTAQTYLAAIPPNAHILPPLASEVLEQQLRAVQAQREALEKAQVWTTPSSPSVATTPVNLSSGSSPSGGWAFSFPATSPPTPRSSATRIRPRGMGGSSTSGGGGSAARWWNTAASDSPLGSVSAAVNAGPLTSPETYWNASATRLNIRPESAGGGTARKQKPLRLQWAAEQQAAAAAAAAEGTPPATAAEPPLATLAPAATSTTAPVPSPLATNNICPPPPDEPAATPTNAERQVGSSTPGSSTAPAPAAPTDPAYDYYQRTLGSGLEAATTMAPTNAASTPTPTSATLAPKLTKPGYAVQPSLETLHGLSEVELAAVQGFSVVRPSFGRVEWIGAVDVRGADLDDIVDIQHGDISVYAVDEANGTKPPEGSKLNRPAILTFYDLYPTPGGAQASPEDFDKLRRKLDKSARKSGADFLSYDENLGEWKIRVQHFSRYGLLDDDDDDDAPTSEGGAVDTSPALSPPQAEIGKRVRVKAPTMPTRGTLKRQATPHYKAPRGQPHVVVVEDVDDDEQEGVDDESMGEFTTEESIRRHVSSQAAKTFQQVYNRLLSSDGLDVTPRKLKSVVTFEQNGEISEKPLTLTDNGSISAPIDHLLEEAAALRPSLSRRVANATRLGKSSIDMGWINRRSFRVGWLPNGSFLKIEGSFLTQVRPNYGSTGSPQRMLETQLKHSIKEFPESCPLFSLPSIEHDRSGIQTALDDFSRETKSFPEASSTFSLLSSHLHARSESQAQAALTQLLLNECAADIARDMHEASQQNNLRAGVVAAVSSGDLVRACEAATAAGMFGLALVLSDSSTVAKADIRQQIRTVASQGDLSKFPPEILIVLKAICGDDSVFGAKGDWRRRVALRMRQNPDTPLHELLKAYDTDIAHSLVPYPFSKSRTNESARSALYQAMRLMADPGSVSLAQVVEPESLAVDRHDYCLTFHLATFIATIFSLSLPPLDAEKIADSYASQLVDCGRWDLAVLVTLCGITEQFSKESQRAKSCRAKHFVLRHYHTGDSACRELLEKKLGLPAQWFEEALACRAGYEGDIDQCVVHLTFCDVKKAISLLEELCLPNIFFLNSKGISSATDVLAAANVMDPNSLAAAMQQYFALDEYMTDLSRMNDGQISADLPTLQGIADSVENMLCLRLQQCRSVSHKFLLPVATTHQIIPLSVMLTSALDRLKVHKMRIRAKLASFVPARPLITS